MPRDDTTERATTRELLERYHELVRRVERWRRAVRPSPSTDADLAAWAALANLVASNGTGAAGFLAVPPADMPGLSATGATAMPPARDTAPDSASCYISDASRTEVDSICAPPPAPAPGLPGSPGSAGAHSRELTELQTAEAHTAQRVPAGQPARVVVVDHRPRAANALSADSRLTPARRALPGTTSPFDDAAPPGLLRAAFVAAPGHHPGPGVPGHLVIPGTPPRPPRSPSRPLGPRRMRPGSSPGAVGSPARARVSAASSPAGHKRRLSDESAGTESKRSRASKD